MSLQTMPYRVKLIDEQPWGKLGFRKIRVKTITFTFGLMRIEKKFTYSRLFTLEEIRLSNWKNCNVTHY